MNRAMFNNALTEVISSEFADVPTDDSQIDIQPSKKFQKKMEKLIKNEQKTIWHYTNTTYKRAAILVAVLVIMFTTACSVSAIREPIVKFFTEAYESFTRYFFEGDTVDSIANIYEITDLPEGFELKKTYSDTASTSTIYENEFGNIIELSQSITNDTRLTIDAEKGDVKEIQLPNREVHLYSRSEISQAFWIENGYLMTLTYEGTINEEEIINLISSVKCQNK